MIDPLSEKLITLNEARRLAPLMTNGKPCDIKKLYRLVQIGSKAGNGERIRLEACRCPDGLRTSLEAVGRFIQRLTDPGAEIETVTPAQRQRAIDRAERELVALGA